MMQPLTPSGRKVQIGSNLPESDEIPYKLNYNPRSATPEKGDDKRQGARSPVEAHFDGGKSPLNLMLLTGVCVGLLIGMLVAFFFMNGAESFHENKFSADDMFEGDISPIKNFLENHSNIIKEVAPVKVAPINDGLPQNPIPQYAKFGDSCRTFQGKVNSTESERRFEIVLLATYPRSGNSWARTLIRGASQLESRLTTVKTLDKLNQAGVISMCPTEQCPTRELAKFLSIRLGIEWAETDKIKVIQGVRTIRNEVQGKHCADLFTAHKKNDHHPWPYYPDLPPVLVKSHYPQIGDTQVEEFTKLASKIIHVVRNPFDNIASRYLGTQHAYIDRFQELEAARKDGKTTQEFAEFLEDEMEDYKEFHDYWHSRDMIDAENGISTLYVRYETLCQRTEEVLHGMVQFAGYKVMEDSIQCTLSAHPCLAANLTLPSHIDIFTVEQRKRVMEVHSPILKRYGYTINSDTWELTLSEPEKPMCN
eukprot:m.7391 g.7391  ORF g.7391 m.7391 type:complete len:479 (-) comp3707_c0_seq1:44-1480(-)